MDNGHLPRQVTSRLDLPGAPLRRAFSHHPPALPSKMPSERLIRAVLSNVESWCDALVEIEHFAIPGNRARIMHLRRNMIQSRISFMRLVNAPEAEIEAAIAQATENMDTL